MAHGSSPDFYLLDARAGWREALLDKVEIAPDSRTLRLHPAPKTGRPLVDAAGTFGGLALPSGVAVDSEGRIYILDGSAHALKRYDPCEEQFVTLPCAGGRGDAPRQMRDPRGLAISPCGDLFIADTGNVRVLVFALKDLVLRAIWPSPRRAALPNPWSPVAVAVTPDCRVLVCDYANGRIHVFDRTGRWRAAYDGHAAVEPPLDKPVHMALDKDGRIYVIQEGRDDVVVLGPDGTFLRRVTRPAEIKGDFHPLAIAVDEHGTLYISERVTRRVYALRESCGAAPQASLTRGLLADCPALAFDGTGKLLVGDAHDHCVRYVEPRAGYETGGAYVSEPLDSELYQCEWHRVQLRAGVPPGTRLRVDTFTAEAARTPAEIDALPDSRWATAQFVSVGEGEWDCLVLSAPGRFLWLRLAMESDGAETPSVEWVKVQYPRETSLRFLPGAYSEDVAGRDFLARFLSIFDRINAEIGDTIGGMARYFDPLATPTAPDARRDFLRWLAGWLDLALDRNLPERRKRALLKNAHRLFSLRGTAAGLRLHVWLYFGVEPHILEHFRLRRWLVAGEARLGDQSVLYGQAIVRRLQLDQYASIGEFQLIDTGDPWRDPFHVFAHQFTLALPVRDELDEPRQLALARIVEASKPAHTQAVVRASVPRFRLDGQTCLGLDTVIGRYPEGVVVAGDSRAGEGRLGDDAVLGASRDEGTAPTMRLGKRARIGATTRLD